MDSNLHVICSRKSKSIGMSLIGFSIYQKLNIFHYGKELIYRIQKKIRVSLKLLVTMYAYNQNQNTPRTLFVKFLSGLQIVQFLLTRLLK